MQTFDEQHAFLYDFLVVRNDEAESAVMLCTLYELTVARAPRDFRRVEPEVRNGVRDSGIPDISAPYF